VNLRDWAITILVLLVAFWFFVDVIVPMINNP
jgi:hypothetical protein